MSRRKSHQRGMYSHRVFRARSASYKARRILRRSGRTRYRERYRGLAEARAAFINGGVK